eukprot:1649552-Amphidinium_carterae.1
MSHPSSSMVIARLGASSIPPAYLAVFFIASKAQGCSPEPWHHRKVEHNASAPNVLVTAMRVLIFTRDDVPSLLLEYTVVAVTVAMHRSDSASRWVESYSAWTASCIAGD